MHCGAVLCIVNHILIGFKRQNKILKVIVKWTDFQRVNTNMHRADHSVPTGKETGLQRQEEVSKNYPLFCTKRVGDASRSQKEACFPRRDRNNHILPRLICRCAKTILCSERT